jgi:hypothetical protein
MLKRLLPLLFLGILGISLFSCKPKVKVKPIAEFQISNQQPRVGDTVVFTCESNNYDKLSWNFGDGSQSEEKNPVHIYKEAASELYVTLKVIKGSDTAVNGDLKISVFALNDTIVRPDTLVLAKGMAAKKDSVKKTSTIVIWPVTVTAGEKIGYTTNADIPFIVDFGGKSTSEAKAGEIIFDEAGQYVIKLTDKASGAVLDKKTVTILEKVDDGKYSSWLTDLANSKLSLTQKGILRNKVYSYCLNNGEVPVTGQETLSFKDFVSKIIIEANPYQTVSITVKIQLNANKKISGIQLETYVKKDI